MERHEVSFSILGPLEVQVASRRIDLGGPQPRLLLARLLLADGRVVSADALVDSLWGEAPPESAHGTLHTYVSRLRRALGPTGPELLRRSGNGYLVSLPEGALDAHRFERLAREGAELLAAGDPVSAGRLLRDAGQLWRGEVLAGIDSDVIRGVAARLEEQRAAAQEDLFDAELQLGAATGAIPGLSDAVRHYPLRERLRALLALALYRSGRQADALGVLSDARRVLGDELGLDLSRELRELQARILAQNPDLDLATTQSRHPPDPPRDEALAEARNRGSEPSASSARVQPADSATSTTMVGRAAETQALVTALAEASSGDGSRYVVIEGEPGIGKTRLAQELLLLAESRGAHTASAATLESGAAPAYGLWLDLLRTLPPAAAEPALAALSVGAPGAPGVLPGAVAGSLADQVGSALAAAAGPEGLVVLLDDLQWADPDSLELLHRLGARLARERVLIVSTVRLLEVGRSDALVEALAQIARLQGTRRLTLRGLTAAQCGELLSQNADGAVDPDIVEALHARSEGNPFFATELARMMVEEGGLTSARARAATVPTGVRDVVQRRVARLPEPTRALLEQAAVVGRQVDIALLAAVSGRLLDDCLDDLEPALVHRLLEVPPEGGALRFTHALVREALVEGISPLRQARIHARAAEAIMASAGDTDDTAEIIAEHLWAARTVGLREQAARALERAGTVALSRQALVSAEPLLERAAGLYRDAGTDGGLAELRLLRQLGFVRAALHGYGVNSDSPLVHRARELAASTSRRDVFIDILWAEWAGADTSGDAERGKALVEQAEALVDDDDGPLVLGGVAAMRGFTERHFGRMGQCEQFIERAVWLLRQAPPAPEAGFYLNGFVTSVGFRHWASALTRGLDHDELEREYREQTMPFGRSVLALFGAASMLAVGDAEGLQTYADRMVAADPDQLLSFWSAAAGLYSGLATLQSGDLVVGRQRFDEGDRQMRLTGGRTMLPGIYAAAARFFAQHGDLEQGRARLADARRELAEVRELAYAPFVDLAAAHLAVLDGSHEQAAQLFEAAQRDATRQGSLALARRIARERAELLNAVGAD